ncbi:MaoC family dehydratase [Hirschia litorea]|uniref:MaoC family dehydratase n=1 Tax=Hirschia litorea TaxID=1199156 RepID=A0ABW2IM84_9PROT
MAGAFGADLVQKIDAQSKVKSNAGNFFEDFFVGMQIIHPTPKTITEGDVALYTGLTGSRYALFSADRFAQDCGLESAPIDPLLAFHVVFGKTVSDISLNAVANLGYADGVFVAPVYPGDTLRSVSEVVGVKENSNGKTGVVYVRTSGVNQNDELVLTYIRWVMVKKRDEGFPAPETVIPELSDCVPADSLGMPMMDAEGWDYQLAGSEHAFEDYEVGEKIDHIDAFTVEEAEHQIATRLYQNTAKVHFNQHEQAQGRFGKRLVYGGVAISLARSIAFNGLANAAQIVGINGGTHVNPLFAGDTVYAWSEVLEKADVSEGFGALRLRLVATKDLPCASFPYKDADGKYLENVILDFDYWAAIPKRT